MRSSKSAGVRGRWVFFRAGGEYNHNSGAVEHGLRGTERPSIESGKRRGQRLLLHAPVVPTSRRVLLPGRYGRGTPTVAEPRNPADKLQGCTFEATRPTNAGSCCQHCHRRPCSAHSHTNSL